MHLTFSVVALLGTIIMLMTIVPAQSAFAVAEVGQGALVL
jgi:hypothetical protein